MQLHYNIAIEQIEQVQIDVTWNLFVRKHHLEQQKFTNCLIDTNESKTNIQASSTTLAD